MPSSKQNESINTEYQKLAELEKKYHTDSLPGFIIIGKPESGKSRIIANSGIEFPFQKNVELALNTVHCWLSTRAVFLEAEIDTSENYISSWAQQLKALKKHTNAKRWRGLIFVLELPNVVENKDDLESFGAIIRNYIKLFVEHFKLEIPVYIFLSKSDCLLGFEEFFHGFDESQINQTCGVFIEKKNYNNKKQVINVFLNKFSDFIRRLESHQLVRLGQCRTGIESVRAYQLPNQFKKLAGILKDLLEHTFTQNYKNCFSLRGVFFCSTKQSFETINLLNEFYQITDTDESYNSPNRLSHKSYFLKGIFDYMLDGELSLAQPSKSRRKIIALRRRLFSLACICASAFFISAFSVSYYYNSARLHELKKTIIAYRQNYKSVDAHILDDLPQLRMAQKLTSFFTIENRKPKMRWGLYLGSELQKATENYYVELSNISLVPAMNAALARQLKKQRGVNLYQTLVVYMMLARPEYRIYSIISNWLGSHWSGVIPKMSGKKLAQLEPTLHNLYERYFQLAGKPIIIDKSLVKHARLNLRSLSTVKLTYLGHKLNAEASSVDSIFFNNTLNPKLHKILVMKDKKLSIPQLFTLEGYKKMLPKFLKSTESDYNLYYLLLGKYQDTLDTLDSFSQQKKYILTWYLKDYDKVWDDNLYNLKVVKFHNLKQAINVTEILTEPNSPLYSLLVVLKKNLINDHDRVNTNSYNTHNTQQLLAQLLTKKGKSGVVDYNAIVKNLLLLHNYLVKIDSAKNPQKTAFTIVKENFTNSDSNNAEIYKITSFFTTLPHPLNKWLKNITMQCWKIILVDARNYVNKSWQQQVYPNYLHDIENYYPFSERSKQEITIENFTKFFGPKGTLTKFINQYLSPFIKRNKTNWKLRHSINGETLSLSNKMLQELFKANEIRRSLFNSDDNKPKIKFIIKPYYLSQNTTKASLLLNKEIINYQHGPQLNSSILWFQKELNNMVILNLTTLQGEKLSIQSNGPWALFKLIGKATLKMAPNRNEGLFKFNLNGHKVTYNIKAAPPAKLAIISKMHSFYLNKKL